MTDAPSGASARRTRGRGGRRRGPRDLRAHPLADHGVLGHVRVHRRGQGARHSPSARQSALHPHGARLRPAAAGPVLRASGSTCSRPSPAPSPPASGSWSPSAGCADGAGALGAARGRVRRRARRRHLVDGLEPVHREREGVHGLAALDRARDVAGGALGRRRAGPPSRPVAGPHRLRAGAHLHQSHDGRAGRAGGGGLRALDRLAGVHPAVGHRRRRASPSSSASRSTTSTCRCAPASSPPSTKASRSASSARH